MRLIAINLIINRTVKTRQYVLIITQSTVHFTQTSQPNSQMQSNAGFEVTVITGPTSYLSTQVC